MSLKYLFYALHAYIEIAPHKIVLDGVMSSGKRSDHKGTIYNMRLIPCKKKCDSVFRKKNCIRMCIILERLPQLWVISAADLHVKMEGILR